MPKEKWTMHYKPTSKNLETWLGATAPVRTNFDKTSLEQLGYI